MSLEPAISLGIHAERKDILIVKGVVAPRAAYEPVAGEIVLVDTPGLDRRQPPALFVSTPRKTAVSSGKGRNLPTMQKRRLGRTGLMVSEISLGTVEIGLDSRIMVWRRDEICRKQLQESRGPAGR